MSLPAISGNELYVSPASSPATNAPDTAVININPFALIASFRKLASAGKAVALTLLADSIGGIKIEKEFHKRNAYNTIAEDKCAARRYCETRGMSFGPSKFFWVQP